MSPREHSSCWLAPDASKPGGLRLWASDDRRRCSHLGRERRTALASSMVRRRVRVRHRHHARRPPSCRLWSTTHPRRLNGRTPIPDAWRQSARKPLPGSGARRRCHQRDRGGRWRRRDERSVARDSRARRRRRGCSLCGGSRQSARGQRAASAAGKTSTVKAILQLVERKVTAAEVGKPLSESCGEGIGLRIYREGAAHGYWEPQCSALREGDVIVEVVPTNNGA